MILILIEEQNDIQVHGVSNSRADNWIQSLHLVFFPNYDVYKVSAWDSFVCSAIAYSMNCGGR